MGLATDAINRLGLPEAQTASMLNAMPVAYAVCYMFGTVGSAILLAQFGPKLLRFNLAEECKKYEQVMGADLGANADLRDIAWHDYELRAYKIMGDCRIKDWTIKKFEEGFLPKRIFVEGIRRNGKLISYNTETPIKCDDILALGGDHDEIIAAFGEGGYQEIEDKDILSQPIEGVDVYVTSKKINGRTLEELARDADAHGVFLRKIKRGATGSDIPVMAKTKIYRGDILTLSGLKKDVDHAAKVLGYADRATNVADVTFIGGAIVIGALVGALVLKVGSVPITLSTAGGTLIAGLVFGWLRSIHPTFGRIPESTVWFMNSVGLNVFIAVVGISAGPGFIAGLKELGLSLFLWGIFATSTPLIIGAFIAKYVFKFHPAILLGCVAGARTTTAALGMICEKAGSNIPSLGYTVTYAVGNTLLTIWGMVIIMILA